MSGGPLLSLQDVSKRFVVRRDIFGRPQESVRAVDRVSLEVAAGATLGIVGESGSGKSTLGRVAMRMVEADQGEITFDGQSLRNLPARQLRRARGQMTMIFQNPHSALDPRWTIGFSIAEPLRVAGSSDAEQQRQLVGSMLTQVGLDPDAAHRRPGAFSGGQRQRIVIARALVTAPKLVFCDEPVSALDVSTRAQVLGLLADLQQERHLAYLFVSHDLAVVQAVSDRIAVMYLGSVVESGTADAVAAQARHPYTASLVSAAPEADPRRQHARQRVILQGDPPSPIEPPSGCTFHPRCPLALEVCTHETPPLVVDASGHAVACHVTGRDPELSGPALLERMTSAGPSRPPVAARRTAAGTAHLAEAASPLDRRSLRADRIH